MRLLAAFAAWLPRALITLVAIGLLNFTLIRLAPGDPAAVIAGESGAGDAAFIAKIRSDYGLDQPLPVQMAQYLGRLARLDLGTSYRSNLPVGQLIAQRLPATLLLTGTALVAAIVLGTWLGVLSARRRGRLADLAIGALAMLCYAMPVFWVGLVLVLVFSVGLGWFPAFGMASMIPRQGLAHLLDVAHHLVLPAVTLALLHLAVYVRLGRSSTLEVLGRDFVRTAQAKGLTEGQVLRGHVLRNAVLPTVTMAGLQVGHLVGGAVVIETVFAWPGIGRLAFDALLQRDYAVILGVFFVSSVMVMLANLLTDVVLRLVDPRIGQGA
jgi:peptide/nickel transport system permease protein